MKKRIVSLLLILVLAFTLVPSAFAAGHNCGISNCVCLPGNPCSAVWEWQAYGSDLHWYVARCSGCGQIEFNWSSQAPHSFDSNGVCTVCGYVYVEPCYHYSTYTEWNGCNWYEYCDDCGALVDSGTSHSYSYGSWTYYNSSQHSRTATCTRCGSTTTSYGSHSTTTRYNTYSSTQHKVQKYCSTCSSYIGSATYESHSFAYGDWQDYSETQHRRTKTCSDCGYSVYEYANHADTNGDGLCDGCSKELTVYVDVKLDACGGVLTEDEVTVIFGDAYGELPEPTREGYIFDGWFTAETGGELVERNTEVGSKTAHTLYAHWTQIKIFSVTVPAGLPLAVTEDGEVTASTDAAIANNSTCDVRVTGVTLRTENGWTLVPFEYNMAAAKVDSKLIGFAIGGAQSVNHGDSEALSLTGDWSIDAGGTLPLDYDANVSATSVGIDEQVLTVVFVVEEVT